MRTVLLVAAICSVLFMAGCGNTSDDSRFSSGLAYFNEGDYAAALLLWQPLAEAGHSDAQHNLGIMYYNGHGVEQSYEEALKWFRLAVEQGADRTALSLAAIYAEGHGVEPDLLEAYKWVHIAMAQQDPDAEAWRRPLVRQMTAEQIVLAEKAAEAWWASR